MINIFGRIQYIFLYLQVAFPALPIRHLKNWRRDNTLREAAPRLHELSLQRVSGNAYLIFTPMSIDG